MQYTLIGYEVKGQDSRGNHKLAAQFKEYDTPVYWAVKNLPVIGQTFDGTVENGEYGPRFKREFAPMAPASAGAAQPFVNASKTGNVAGNNDSREDGMRQGMCINNAANYIAALYKGETVDQFTWANLVWEYANALYNKGNLLTVPEPGALTDTADVTDEELANVSALFDSIDAKKL